MESCAPGDARESVTLQGWRRILGMAVVESTLKGLGRPSNADALERWYLNCNCLFRNLDLQSVQARTAHLGSERARFGG